MESKVNVLKRLYMVQQELKAPKGQTNAFAKFKYRSCEDILEAVKPLLKKYKLVLTISDDIIVLGEGQHARFYVKATSILTDKDTGEEIKVSAMAREDLKKAGNCESQITGAASSYARKYSLNGLLAIDDNKDLDGDSNK